MFDHVKKILFLLALGQKGMNRDFQFQIEIIHMILIFIAIRLLTFLMGA